MARFAEHPKVKADCDWDPELLICRAHWCWVCDEDHCPSDKVRA